MMRRLRVSNSAKRKHVTLFAASLAVYAAVLYRWTGQTDLLVGAPVSN